MLSPRNVRSSGCPRMVFRTRPHGHRPSFSSSGTSTPSFLPSTIVRRNVCRLSQRSMLGLMVDSTPRTVSLSSRKLLPSSFHNLTTSLSLPLCGMRTLSPMLLLLSSPHIIGSPNRYSEVPFWDLKLMFVGSCHDEQLSWCSQQHIVATVEDSVLRTEMPGLESQEGRGCP